MHWPIFSHSSGFPINSCFLFSLLSFLSFLFKFLKTQTTHALIVKCDGQCVQHRYGCRGEIGNIFLITFSYLEAWECCVKVHMYVRLHVGTIGDVGPGCWTSALPAISKSPRHKPTREINAGSKHLYSRS